MSESSSSRAGWRLSQWANETGVSRSLVYKLLDANRIESVKIGAARPFHDPALAVKAGGDLEKLLATPYPGKSHSVDEHIKEHGKLRVLLILQDFHGWTAGAMWEDSKFDLKHWRDIERLAAALHPRSALPS
mgnify:CR=1 FL=1